MDFLISFILAFGWSVMVVPADKMDSSLTDCGYWNVDNVVYYWCFDYKKEIVTIQYNK